MKVLTTYHPSSSVQYSVKATLTADPEREFLVVGKLDTLQVYSIQPEGLRLECSLDLWGRVMAIKNIPTDDGTRSNLLIMLDHPDPELIVLEYTISNNGNRDVAGLKTVNHLSLYERSARAAEFCNTVILDPSGTVAVASCYKGKLKVLLLEEGTIQRDFDVSITELNLLDFAFINAGSDGELCLALLHIDHQQRIQLLSRDLDISTSGEQLSPKPSNLFPPLPLSAKTLPHPQDNTPFLVAVPPVTDDPDSLGGIIVLGGKKIQFYELAAPEAQVKLSGKAKRTEQKKKKASADEEAALKLAQKEQEREWRKRKPRSWVEWPWSEVESWCRVGDEEGGKYLIGDIHGRLAMLSLDEKRRFTLVPLGQTSSAMTLTYLTSQVLFVGSHHGDSQVIQINQKPVASLDQPTLPVPSDISTVSISDFAMHPSRKGKGKWTDATELREGQGLIVLDKGSFLKVLDTWKNIGPILDAALVDTDGSGQKQIVTCSGGRNTGSLNVVRNGADFQTLAVAEGITNVTKIWPLRASYDDVKDTHIFLSTLHESHLFKVDGGTRLTRIGASGTDFITQHPTLAIGNIRGRIHKKAAPSRDATSDYVDSPLVVQITSLGAMLYEYDMALGQYLKQGDGWLLEKTEWKGRKVIAADINASQFILGLTGGRVVFLNLVVGKNEINCQGYRDIGDSSGEEISAISCTPLNPAKNFTNHIAVSFWGSNRVKVYSTDLSNSSVVCQTPSLRALPRFLFFHNFGHDTNSKGENYHPHLLVGLGDGTLVSYSFRAKTLGDERVISLGDVPISLSVCPGDDRKSLIACGSRTSVLFWERETLRHSPVTLKDIAAACPLNTSGFSSCLVLSTSNGLVIGRVRDVDKMHIRTISLGQINPARISHHQNANMFGVICSQAEPVRIGDLENITSTFKVLDHTTFDQLDQYDIGYAEAFTIVRPFSVPFKLQSQVQQIHCFAVGSSLYKPGDVEPSEGQVIIFRIGQEDNSPAKLIRATSTQVYGHVHEIVDHKEMVAVAVNSSVMLFRMEAANDDSSPSISLQKVAEWNHNYTIASMVECGDTIMIGDAYNSVSFLKFDGSRLVLLAKNYGPDYPHSIQAFDEEHLIGINIHQNIFAFSLQRSELQTSLERDGNYHLGDLINKFIPGAIISAEMSDNVKMEPKQLFFTSSGRIGVVLDLDKDISLHLDNLQRNMAQVIEGPGSLSHTRYRAPRNQKGRSDAEVSSYGFLDGDFLERFLNYLPSSELMDKIIQGNSPPETLKLTKESIQKVLERLHSLH